MKLLQYYYFLFVLFAYSEVTYAQNPNKKIAGNVLDDKNQPIEFVLIKVNNSTIFTETDSLGFFVLNIPENVFKIGIIISRVGFQTNSIEIESIEKPITIYLKNDPQLDDVQIIEERSTYWKRKLKIFKEALLGDSPYAKSCKILNENDIIINILEGNKMEVTFKKNLKILNNDLGYILVRCANLAARFIVKDLLKFFETKDDLLTLSLGSRSDFFSRQI